MENLDKQYMRRAMELAENGRGFVNPNPLVGAVIVKEGRVIGEGWHTCYGSWHAEREALRHAVAPVEGATLYVTLEPCCHHGKTPPCTDAIIEHKIGRVVVGLTDPNPKVAGKGIALLRAAGIEVITGVEEEALKIQNRVFLKYITSGMPWITLKTAMTLDGKIATCTGDSKWVSGEESRALVQQMRGEYMGIMVGAHTVRLDDPMLNCRLPGEVRQPVRIVVDSRAGIALDSQLVRTARKQALVVAHTDAADMQKLELLREAGVTTLPCETLDGHVNVTDMARKLGERGIDSILLEGGGELNYSFIRAGLVDEAFAFIATKYVGGKEARTPVEGAGIERMEDAVVLRDVEVQLVGEDVLVKGKIKGKE